MRISDWSSDVCSSDLAAPADARYLVDLPGYGYAKVPQDLQAHWQAFLDAWFGSRQALRGLVVVMDIRHPLKDYDRQMIGYAVRSEERRVGKEGGSQVRSRGSPYH